MKVVGGEVTSAAALAPKCGPIGLPPKKVGEDIQKATSKWRGVKIEIEIAVQNRQCTVKVLPTAAPLLIEALKEGGRDRKKVKNVTHTGNVKLDDVVRIAKTMREAKKSMAVKFEGSVKEILGTAVSLGCTVDGKSPKDIQAGIDAEEIKV
jgi:large subunit ribosomal protein L12e